MTYPDFVEIKTSLLAKQHTKSRLKPAEEGFNAGLLTAIAVLEKSVGQDYESVKRTLLSRRKTGLCTNREDGFNDAILRAASKLKDVAQKGSATGPRKFEKDLIR